MVKRETTEKYLKQSQKENQPIISCYDNDKNIISNPSAIKTINSIYTTVKYIYLTANILYHTSIFVNRL